MPTRKQPFWIEYTIEGRDGDGKPMQVPGRLELSVRRSRAMKQWRKLRLQAPYRGSTFHEPPARVEGAKRHQAQEARTKYLMEVAAKKSLKVQITADATEAFRAIGKAARLLSDEFAKASDAAVDTYRALRDANAARRKRA